ncbi:tetratricopeptide repeat protein [Kitasatospora sp. NPDC004615]|uniref:tetratricopeptide repeat protein n=1 Tax=Kitasatospora sp. NPDC004615 TaxID=3364017 RepID=UPI00368546C1
MRDEDDAGQPPSGGPSFVTHVGGSAQAFVAGRDMVFQGPGPRALAGLPTDYEYLIGRQPQLAALREFLSASPDALSFTPVALISGFAGSGKTALAVSAARQALENGEFAGGVVFVDLNGIGRPHNGGGALDSALRSLGVRQSELGGPVAERARLYRSLLHERGREHGPVLVVVDGAEEPEQVLPLLPGDEAHKLLVTSRRMLAVPGARVVVTGPLGSTDSSLVLMFAVERTGLSPGRVSFSSRTADFLPDLMEECGHLPAVVTSLAAQFTQDPGLTAGALYGRLKAAIDSYARGGPANGPLLSVVRRGFDETLLRLGPEAAELLPLLALAEGPDITTDQVGYLTGAGEEDLRSALADLAGHHLLVEDPIGSDRWRLPGFARREARALAARLPGPVRTAAQRRLLDQYVRMARTADEDNTGATAASRVELRVGRELAKEWFDAERHNVVAAVTMAIRAGLDQQAVDLALPVGRLLLDRHLLKEAGACTKAGLAAAERIGDRSAEAGLVNLRGVWLIRLGQDEKALGLYERARAIYAEIGDLLGQAKTSANIGNVQYARGELRLAYAMLRSAAVDFRELGDTGNEAEATRNAANIMVDAKDYESAHMLYGRAVSIHRDRGDQLGEAWALEGLGDLFLLLENPQEALSCFGGMRVIGQVVEDPGVLGSALYGAARAISMGKPRQRRQAQPLLKDAVVLLEAAGDRRKLAAACYVLGVLLYEERKYPEAHAQLQRAGLIHLEEFGDEGAAGGPMGLMVAAERAMENRGVGKKLLGRVSRVGHRPAWEVPNVRVTSFRPGPWEAED